MGLGKTIEAALVYEELKARGLVKRVLIVAPSGLCLRWQEEMRQKFNEEFVIYDRETVQTLKNLHGQSTNIWILKDKIISSLDFIKPKKTDEDIREAALSRRVWHNEHVSAAAVQAGFDLVIIDEAHKLTKDISGEETARYKVGKALAETVPYLLLSATPHQGDSARFRYLLNLIDPHLFYRGCELIPQNVKAITVRNNKRAVVDFQGQRLFKQRITSICKIKRDKPEDQIELKLYEAVYEYVTEFYNLAEQQKNQTMMFLLLIYQRMVSSSSQAIWKSLSNRLAILKEVRQKLDRVWPEGEVQSEFEPEDIQDLVAEAQMVYLENQVAQHQIENVSYLQMEIDILEHLVDLARRASLGRNDAKFRTLLEIIDEFRMRENDPELKFIIFTEFVETQSYINNCLQNLGYKTAIMNGRMSPEERQAAKEFFRNEASFLISTDAGREGINLQFCRILINYDLPWNPMRLEQRIGRIDRIGQKHDVKVVNFQLEDTVEQKVRTVIEEKLERIKQEFNDGEDKLADILSTLDDEFSFDQIYVDAVQKRLHDAAQLEKLA